MGKDSFSQQWGDYYYTNNGLSLKRSISSSEVRMSPRPPKSPAWSVPPLINSCGGMIDDPSSCSDNASDNSDKIETLCSSSSVVPTSKMNRKRKIHSNSTTFSSSIPSNGNVENNVLKSESSTTAPNTPSQGSLWAEAESLAADFDGSLSGLGGDLSGASYDMSEALLALPSIYHHHHRNNATNQISPNSASPNNSSATNYIKEAGLTPLSASHLHGGSSVSLPGDFHFEPHPPSPPPQNLQNVGNSGSGIDCERRFQYVLAAATSIATKVNEETLTYLNQGQPYEIKLKKLGELTAYRSVVFRSVIRLCFHDRRLQFSEREQIAQWEDSHLNDRILQVDLPLSYGATILPNHSDVATNTVSFLWEPLKEVGLYVKVNCISTEFTPKKHGGEKGVPFRMMIETYSHPDNVRLHASACQIKVFKLKGADRKHKQDREKILKKTPGEQAKLQPSYDCTVLTDISLESLESPAGVCPTVVVKTQSTNPVVLSPSYSCENGVGGDSPESYNGTHIINSQQQPTNGTTHPNFYNFFTPHFSPESVRRWLLRNRFSASKALWDYSGLDLLRLSKEELVEMCGLAEGIRLYNALHYKITFYLLLSSPSVSLNPVNHERDDENEEKVFHPICLSSHSISELTSVLSSLFHNNSSSQSDGSYSKYGNQSEGPIPVEKLFLTVHGPSGNSKIRAFLTEQLLTTLKDQSAFRAYKHANEAYLELLD